jgi:hypothetical protein
MSFKSTVIALALTVFGAAAAFAQSSGDLSFHRTVAGPSEFIQRTAVLPLPTSPASSFKAGPSAVPTNVAVEAALQWLVQHGYLTQADLQSAGPSVTVSGTGITITFHVPGGPDAVIVLSNGPFLPTDIPHRLMSVIVVRPVVDISNGF